MDRELLTELANRDPKYAQAVDMMEEQLAREPIVPEDMNEMIEVLEFVLQNPDKYAEVVAAAVADGEIDEGMMPPQFDPTFVISLLVALYGLQDRMGQRGYARGGLAVAARRVASAGRGGDTQLAHINRREAEMLRRAGGSGTVNPETGLAEYKFSFKKILGAILPIALSFILPGVGTAIGTALGASGAFASALGGAVIGGASGALTGGGLKGALTGAAFGGIGGGFGQMAGGFLSDSLGLGLGQTAQGIVGGGLLGAGVGGLTGGVKGALTGALTGGAGAGLNAYMNSGMGGESSAGASGFSSPESVDAAMLAQNQADYQGLVASGDAAPNQSLVGVATAASAAPPSPSKSIIDSMKSGLSGIFGGGTPAAGQAAGSSASGLGSLIKYAPLVLAAGSMFSGPEEAEQAVAQLSPEKQEYFNRPSITWDWDKLQSDANRSNMSLQDFMARNWNSVTSGEYNNPVEVAANKSDTVQMAAGGLSQVAYLARGAGTGRSDQIKAMLSDGEYVMDAETVAMIGDGSTDAGAKRLDQMRSELRKHKGKALSKGKFSPNAKSPLSYLKGAA